jgi:hypothetical protein
VRCLALALLLLSASLLESCTAIWMDEPLSQPRTAHYDPRVLGNWYARIPDQKGNQEGYIYLRVASGDNDTLDVFALGYSNSSEGLENANWYSAIAFPTVIADRTYYNVRVRLIAGPDREPASDFQDGYFLAQVAVGSDDLLNLKSLNEGKLWELEKSGDIRLRKEGYDIGVYHGYDLFVETPGPEIAALIGRLGPEGLFDDDAIVLSRLGATPIRGP